MGLKARRERSSFSMAESAPCAVGSKYPSLLNLLILKTRILLSGGHRKRASTSNFPLEMNARFERRIFNLFYKNLLCTRQHEVVDLWPKEECGPSVHRPLSMTCVDEGIAGFGVGRFERKFLITKVVFAVFTIAIAGPDKLLRAFAAVVILFLLTDGTGHAIEVLKLLFGTRDFFLEGTAVDKVGVVFTLICIL